MGTHALVNDDGRLQIAEFGQKQSVALRKSRHSISDTRGSIRLAVSPLDGGG